MQEVNPPDQSNIPKTRVTSRGHPVTSDSSIRQARFLELERENKTKTKQKESHSGTFQCKCGNDDDDDDDDYDDSGHKIQYDLEKKRRQLNS